MNNQFVRNPQGIWINTNPFRQEAINFTKNGFYCADPYGSPAYMEYWDEQLRRCTEGYEVGGVKITGHHYNYLNFSRIMVAEEVGGKVAKKKEKFPDFWDGDYNFYWCKEIARYGMEKSAYEKLGLHVTIPDEYLAGGNHMIVGKSRRKGYSFKNAAICANNYNTTRNSISLIGAFDKKYLYPKGTMGMASRYLSWYNEHTAWRKGREYVDKQEHKKASYKKIKEGVPIEAGYQSQIIAVSFKDNPDAARGVDALDILFEEAGKFPNLEASVLATLPGLTAGKYITGQMMIFGTGGDMEDGTVDFAKIFYNPTVYKCMPFVNIWDDNAENSTCGFFHPVTWNMEGHYDIQGNSDIDGATKEEEEERDRIKKASVDSVASQQRVQEYPFNPSEAFLTVSTNDFPVIELRNRLNALLQTNSYIKRGQPVHLYRDNETKKVVAKPDLLSELDPIWKYKPNNKNLKGSVVIYEYPMTGAPKGLYKIGYDPYRQEQSKTSGSLASIYVYKSTHAFSFTRETIVAQFIGRPYDPDDVNRIAEMLAELYNTEVMYENEVTHVKSYFTRIKKLHLLAAQPDKVISTNINNSDVARIFGIHMVDKLKDAGEKYIKQWLLTERDIDEFGNKLYNLDFLDDPGLIEELILYNRKGNFDRVMSFMMVMFQCQEEELGKVYGEQKTNQNAQDLVSLMNKQFKNRN